MRDAIAIVLQPAHLRKTLKIAFVVGCVLTLINQADVFVRGEATAVTIVKTGLNFCVPFVVSNLGLLAGKRAEADARAESGILWAPEEPPGQGGAGSA